MEAQNPYAAPTAAVTATPGERVDFVDLDTPRLKKLYYRSVNLGTIGVLLVLGAALLISLPLWLPEGMGIPVFRLVVLPRFVAPLIGIFELVAAYGLFRRPGWGRPIGIIASAYIITGLNLIAIIVGIAGIVACSAAPELFGADRVRHRALKVEFKRRKREKIA